MGERALGQMLVGNIIETAATRAPEKLAYVCAATKRRLTFRETNARSNQLANGLAGLGLARGDVLAFLCSNRAEIAEIYFALAKSGIIGIPLNYRLAPAEVAELMRAMGAQALVYEARFASCAEYVREHLAGVRQYVVIGATAPARDADYESLLAAASAAPPEVAVGDSDGYYFNLTSGTTGLPKSYLLTQFNNSMVAAGGTTFDLTRHDVVLTALPAFGRIGVAWMLLSAVHGIPNVLANFEPAETLRLIEQEGVTIFNVVPTMAAMLLASERLPASDLSSLRAIVFAGAVLPAPIRQQAAARLCPAIYEYYGMQETGIVVHSTPADRAMRPDSVGRATLFAEVKVVDAHGQPLPAGELGEIVARTPATATSYFQDPLRSAETFRDGWVHTGDLGSFDAEGFLFIRGRKKDLIISGGQNVHAAEVEETLLHHDGVAECAVIGLPDALWGEQVAAVIVRAPGAAVDAEALRGYCRERLAGFKTPKTWLFQTEALPRTATGKIQKFVLVAKYGRGKD